MLWLLAALALAIWIVGLAFQITSGVIHVALVAAVIFFIAGFFRGRGSATGTA